MINFIKRKRYLVLATVCVVGFATGHLYSYPDYVISCEEAYNMAIAAVVDKMDNYNMAFEIDDISENSDDFEYEVFYCPTAKQLCYEVEEIAGHITNEAESEEIEVYFYVTVSLDGSYVEVASTLCY